MALLYIHILLYLGVCPRVPWMLFHAIIPDINGPGILVLREAKGQQLGAACIYMIILRWYYYSKCHLQSHCPLYQCSQNILKFYYLTSTRDSVALVLTKKLALVLTKKFWDKLQLSQNILKFYYWTSTRDSLALLLT